MNTAGRVAHAAIGLLVLAALLTQTVLSVRTAGVPASTSLIRLFSYFTVESNILVCVPSLLLAWRPGFDGPVFRVVRLDGLLGIAVTGVVYAAVLAGQSHPTGLAAACTVAFHYLAPPLAVLAWLAFGPRPRIKWLTCAWALVWPLAWVAWTLVHGRAAHWYPYPFIDVGTHGYPRVLLNVAVVAVILAVFAAVFRLLDPVLPGDRAGTPAGRLGRVVDS